MKKIGDHEIIDHGIQHSQYFQGCGTSLTEFDDVATGIGDDYAEALEDALESLAQNDWDTAGIPDADDDESDDASDDESVSGNAAAEDAAEVERRVAAWCEKRPNASDDAISRAEERIAGKVEAARDRDGGESEAWYTVSVRVRAYDAARDREYHTAEAVAAMTEGGDVVECAACGGLSAHCWDDADAYADGPDGKPDGNAPPEAGRIAHIGAADAWSFTCGHCRATNVEAGSPLTHPCNTHSEE